MPPDNKALSRRWFEEVWNQGRDEVIDELFAPGAIAHGLADNGQDLPGPAEFRRFYRQFRSGFPDVRITVDEVVAERDLTCCRITGRGTHSGDGLGIKATGRKVTVSGMVMIRWSNGQIVEAWNEFDSAGLMKQISAPLAAPVKMKA
jgi:predicted ester cyclase